MGAPTPFVNAFDTLPVGSYRYNTSMAGGVLPIAYGTCRVSVNLLEFWGWSGASTKGGKGGAVSGKKEATYSVYVAFGISQGSVTFTGASHGIAGNNRIWANAGIAAGFGNVGLNAFLGADGQAPDPVFESEDPNQPVLGYSGTAYTTGDPLQLGQSPSLPNLSFEVTGFEAGTCGTAQPDDARPDLIVTDLLTNARYGAGFPAANLDSAGTLANFGEYCQAAQLGMSLLLDRQQSAKQWIDDICTLTVAAPFWSGAQLKIVPYATVPFSGNGAIWQPALTAQYSLDDDDFIAWGGGSDPVAVSRSDPAAATNWLGLEYYDSINSYNPNIAYRYDQGAIDAYGLRDEPSNEAHSFTNLNTAQNSAEIQLLRKQQVRNTFKFQLGWIFALLDPMDIVELTDSGAGLYAQPVRIIGVEENDNGELSITAEELPNVATTPPVYPFQTPAAVSQETFAAPGNANAPILFEPPPALTGGLTQLWLVSSGGANWGGANVLVSTDGSAFAYAGTVYMGARQGILGANLAAFAGTNPDTADTLAVNLTESEGTMVSASSGDAAAFVTLCWCGGELLSYETATLTGANQYDLTTLYRGGFGTVPGAHASGANFAYLGLNDGAGIFKYTYPPTLIGQTITVKLQSFNTYGQELQEISALTPYTYTLTGAGAVETVNVPVSCAGIPQSGTPILDYTFGAAASFPANLAGSVCTAGTAATSNTSFNLAKNGTNFATMSFAASGAAASFSGSAESFAAGDVLKITPARTDATLANLTGNLAGSS